MTIVPKKKSDSRSTNKPNVVPKSKQQQDQDQHHQEHEHHTEHQDLHRRSPSQCSTSQVGPAGEDVDYSGYNSGDEHSHERQPSYMQWTEQEFQEREVQFEQKINKKGWVIKKMAEDGACLFRAVADQIYGDQDMHSVLRKLCVDYIAKNSDYFSHYVTEDFGEYLKRKSLDHSHGNHIEIQAMSEMFNRPIEVYHYSSEPINIFQGPTSDNEPIRLSYHRSVHYNSIVDPFKATVGVGLGLPAYDPGLADKSLLEDAIRLSDEDAIEKAMLEDKLLATDWEATNDAIEEQVARESYLEWLRENESRFHKKFKKSSSPQPTTAAAACSKQSSSSTSDHQSSTSSSSSSSATLAPEQIAGCSTSPSTSFRLDGQGNATPPDPCNEAGPSAASTSTSYQATSHKFDRCSPESDSLNQRSPRASSSRDVS